MRTLLSLALIAALWPAATGAAAPTEGPLQYRAWSTLHDDPDYLRELIPRAAAAGMNRLQLSHGVVDRYGNVDNLLSGDRAQEITARVNAVCTQARAAGLAVDIWVNELSSAPPEHLEGRRVKLSDAYWSWLEAKYDRVFEKVPGVDGLVVTAWETRYAVINDAAVVSEKSPAERVADLAGCFARICKKHDKQLIFRTFTYTPEQLKIMREGLALAAQRDPGLHERLWVMLKCVPADWMPYYPYNPALGEVGGLRQIVELDLGMEFSGQSLIPFGQVDYVKRVLDHARAKGATGAVARVDRFANSALNTPNEVNLHAFDRLVNDPSPGVEELWLDWARQRYPGAGTRGLPPASLLVVRALRRSFDINNMIFSPLGEWMTNHSRVPTWRYVEEALSGWSLNHWIGSPVVDRSRDEFFHPTPEMLTRLAMEKEAARRLCREAMEDILQTRVLLPEADYQQLLGQFERMATTLDVHDHAQQALFSAWRYVKLDTPAEHQLPTERMILRYRILGHLAALERLEAEVAERFGADFLCARPADIRAFREDVVKRLGLEEAVALRSHRFAAGAPQEALAWQEDLRARFFDLLKMSDLVRRDYSNPFNPKVIASTDEGSWELSQIEINSTPTRRMVVLVGMPKGIESPRPAVVAIGGHGSTQWSPYDRRPRSLYAGFGNALSEAGYITISALVSQHHVYEEGRTLMGERLWDLMRCVDYLESLPEVDRERMGCGGLSLGGEMVMWLAAMDTRMKASVSCGFLTLMDQMERGHCMCWKFPGERELVDYPDIYAMTAPRALQCQNGLREPVGSFYVPVARAALEEIAPAYRVFDRAGRLELHVHDGGHEIDTPALLRFIAEHLP